MNRTKRTSARVSSFFVFLRRGCGSGGTHGCRPTEDNRWARCGRAAGCGHPALRARGKGARCGRDVGDAASYAGSGGAVRGYYGLPHQCAHWFAMTRGFESAVRGGSEVRAPRPTEAGRGGAMQAGRRGNRRSAAGGGRSEPISRKCPDWRPRQWTGIGWHDGGQSPPPTKTAMCLVPRRCGCGA